MNRRMPQLQVRNLSVYFPVERGIVFRKRIGWLKAVDDISFDVYPGESVGLVGESGCGKSTTAMAIARLQEVNKGEIIFNGRDLLKLSSEELRSARKDLQVIFQDPYSSLDPRMNAFDCIAEPLRVQALRGKKADRQSLSQPVIADKVYRLMDKVGLAKEYAQRYPHEFSGGQRQRIGIARALALSPQLVIADEPVSALDVSIQAQILNLMKDLQGEFGLTYLFIAHNLAVVSNFSDRIIVMYLGTIVEIASSEELYGTPLHPYTRALLSAVPIPDPPQERKRSRTILKGDVPSPLNMRTGCPFADRCPDAKARCQNERPKLSTVKGITAEHQVACYLYDKV
ncbi:MAG TPA: ATP-binding cassette domain-containing protein [Spirochaetales bacterium]|nr:ATP-binding cassette domain-containing protein [Spirochaetales bacterium]